MSRKAKLLAMSTILAAAAACTSEHTIPISAPQAPFAATSAALSTCDFRAMLADAKTYFGSGNQPVFDEIRQMSNACKAGDVNATIDNGFDVLAWVAKVTRDGTQQGTPSDGATLVNDVLVFDVGLDSILPTTAVITRALSSRGLFEVRGKNATFININEYDAPIYSRNAVQNQVPAWGASPQGGNSWTGGTRFLAYGYPLLLNTEIQTSEKPIAYGFDFERYPSGSFPNPVITGVCVQAATTDRIQHFSGGATMATLFLPFSTLTCPDYYSTLLPASNTASAEGRQSFLGRVIAGALNFITPTTVYAGTSIGGVGGLGSTWSPHIGVDLVAVTLSLASGYPIADGYISQPIVDTAGNPIRIAVRAAGNTGLSGVTVTVAVYNNSGTNVGVSLDSVFTPTVSAVTNAYGIADFTGLRVNKAGGYILVATGAYDGITGGAYKSNLFNMQNK